MDYLGIQGINLPEDVFRLGESGKREGSTTAEDNKSTMNNPKVAANEVVTPKLANNGPSVDVL